MKSKEFDLLFFSVAAAIFAVYLATLSPSIAGGDSGELVSEGCHLGTAHPPGYPLLTMIVYGLHRLVNSFGQIQQTAYCVNLSSALFMTLASCFIGLTVQSLNNVSSVQTSSRGDILGMCLFSFSRLIWQYAVTAEVFPLNTLFSALIVYLTVVYTKNRSMFVLYFGSFVCGLAICNQHTIILYEAPLILWMLFVCRKLLFSSPFIALNLSGLFIFGLLPYVYLPIAEILSPKAGSWGHLSSLSGFVHHFLRKDYGTFQLFSGETGRNSEGMIPRTFAFIHDLTYYQAPHYVVPYLLVFAAVAYIVTLSFTFYVNPVVSVDPSEYMASSNSSKKPSKKSGIKSAVSKPRDIILFSAEISIIDENVEYSLMPLVLILTLVFYLAVFHSLANLPLSDKLLYGVHQRFWMQPNVIVFILVGFGFDALNSFLLDVRSFGTTFDAKST